MAGIELKRRDGLREFADSVMQGAQAGQQYATNTLRQQGMKNELAEYDRQQQIRSGLAAIQPEDYAGQAGVFQRFGETDKAAAAQKMQRQEIARMAYMAARQGDYVTAAENANKLYGTKHVFKGVGKDGALEFDTPAGADAKGGMTFKRARLPEAGFLQSLAVAGGPELAKAYELDLKEREMVSNAAALRAMGGAQQGNHGVVGEITGPKGERLPVSMDSKTGKYHVNGRPIDDQSFQKIRWLDKTGGGAQTPQYGEQRTALEQGVAAKQFEQFGITNEQTLAQRRAQADAADRITRTKRLIRPGEQDPRVLLQLFDAGVTGPELITAGALPEAV